MPEPSELPSSRDLKDCHPELQKRWAWVERMYYLLYPGEPQPLISSTYRSKADQDREVAEGSSKLAWPHSTHNTVDRYGKPASIALDFFFTVDGKTSYPRLYMERVINLVRLAGMFSGATWGWDAPHVALVETRLLWVDDYPLIPLPKLPVVESTTVQPVIRYHDAAGVPTLWRGEGDILIRISSVAERLDQSVIDIRYDKKEK